jgi:hypothetical protein
LRWSESFNTFVAQIVELSMGDEGPKVHKVWCAVDCGVAVNPDIIRAQMEGGIGFGLGHILYADVPMEGGRVVPGNFDAYRSLRINEMPAIEVTIVKSNEKPTGVGEPGVPPIGPAVANAMAKLGQDSSAAVADRAGSIRMKMLRQGVMALGAGAFAAALLAFAGPAFRGEADAAMEPPVNPVKLKPVSAFGDIKNPSERAVALFEEAGKVIMSPRCLNCHPATERPTQTDKMRPHQPLVVRGRAAWARRPVLPATPVITRRTSIPPMCRVIRSGISRRWRWHGRANRSARSASRSRTRSATTARTWTRW